MSPVAVGPWVSREAFSQEAEGIAILLERELAAGLEVGAAGPVLPPPAVWVAL